MSRANAGAGAGAGADAGADAGPGATTAAAQSERPRPLARAPRPLPTLTDLHVPLDPFVTLTALSARCSALLEALDFAALGQCNLVYSNIPAHKKDFDGDVDGVRGMAAVVDRTAGAVDALVGTDAHKLLSPLLDALIEDHCAGYHCGKVVLLKNVPGTGGLGHQDAHFDGGPSLWLPLTTHGRFLNFYEVTPGGDTKRTTVFVEHGHAALFDAAHGGAADAGCASLALHIELGCEGSLPHYERDKWFGHRFVNRMWPQLDRSEKAVLVAQAKATAEKARAYRDRRQVHWQLAVGDKVWAHRASAIVLAGGDVDKSTMANVLCAPPFCARASGREVTLHNVSAAVRNWKVQQALEHCGGARGQRSAFLVTFDTPQVSFCFCISASACGDSQCAFALVCCCTGAPPGCTCRQGGVHGARVLPAPGRQGLPQQVANRLRRGRRHGARCRRCGCDGNVALVCDG